MVRVVDDEGRATDDDTAVGNGPNGADMIRVDVAVIGGGGATETFVRTLGELVGVRPGDADDGLDVVVFEPNLVGGECPFVACMPSKTLLHDAATGRSWAEAVERRRGITADLDDTEHADDLVEQGVRLVRAAARLVAPNVVEADGRRYRADHVVLATGARSIVPPLDGSDTWSTRVWTSDDAMTAGPDELPGRLVIVGGGVIGIECATLFHGFGTDVVLLDSEQRLLGAMPPRVGELVTAALQDLGVQVRTGVEVASVTEHADDVAVELADGSSFEADRVLLAVGRRASTDDLGLEHVGLPGVANDGEPLPVDPNGRVRCEGSVWAMGDVAGRGQYTHLANHHARVVADHIAGTATREFDEVVVPGCVFADPPIVQVGPSWAELDGDADVVSAAFDLGTFPRSMTDELPPGHLWVAARRSTGCVVAAAGVGPRFDELSHALVIAIDGAVPVARLRRSMQPFPTVGEILGPVFDRLHTELTG